MEYEQTKEYLKRYRKNRALVNRLKDKIINTNNITQELLIETKQRIQRLEDKGVIIYEDIYNAIKLIDNDKSKVILTMHYLKCDSVMEIAKVLKCSERNVYIYLAKGVKYITKQCYTTGIYPHNSKTI